MAKNVVLSLTIFLVLNIYYLMLNHCNFSATWKTVAKIIKALRVKSIFYVLSDVSLDFDLKFVYDSYDAFHICIGYLFTYFLKFTNFSQKSDLNFIFAG